MLSVVKDIIEKKIKSTTDEDFSSFEYLFTKYINALKA